MFELEPFSFDEKLSCYFNGLTREMPLLFGRQLGVFEGMPEVTSPRGPARVASPTSTTSATTTPTLVPTATGSGTPASSYEAETTAPLTTLDPGAGAPLPSSDLYGASASTGLTSLDGLTFDKLTPTGTRIMRAAREWMDQQSNNPSYPKARMCARNVTKVLHLAGISRYNDEGVRNLIDDVRRHGGVISRLPTHKAAFIAKLNLFEQGRLPAGTLVAGESSRSANPGDQHVGFIGHTDPDGTVWLYHNNWYRPENEGGARRPHMVSAQNLSRGFPRQFMATPWVKLVRDQHGTIVDVTSLMPQIDDMDPFNPNYGITLALPSEIASELH